MKHQLFGNQKKVEHVFKSRDYLNGFKYCKYIAIQLMIGNVPARPSDLMIFYEAINTMLVLLIAIYEGDRR